MKTSALTPDEYISELPNERKAAMAELRNVILRNIPKGFEETISYGMITYVVPHSLYPKGYHTDPKQPLPFVSIASQKNFIAVYHMGMYADPKLLEWFQKEYVALKIGKPDMGKSCMRFKKIEQIPFDLIGLLCRKMNPQDWIQRYESMLKK